jgi:plastocyanin
MAQTLYNGIVVPTNGDAYNLTADLATMGQSGITPIPVASLSARNALAAAAPGGVLPVPTVVIRKDQSMFIETWDGSTWKAGGHVEWTRTSQVVPNITVWGVGALTQDSAQTLDTAFITHPASDQLKFRDAGTYAITFTARASAAPSGRSFVEIQSAGSAVIRTVMTGEDRGAAVIPNYRAAANEILTFDVYQTSGGNLTYDFRIRVTRVA